jgi:hypothetical protein
MPFEAAEAPADLCRVLAAAVHDQSTGPSCAALLCCFSEQIACRVLFKAEASSLKRLQGYVWCLLLQYINRAQAHHVLH